MIDFDELNKVTNVVCKPTPTLTVKHVLYLKRNPYSDSKPYMQDPSKARKLDYAFPYEANGTCGMYMQCGDVYLELEARRQTLYVDKMKPDTKSKSASIKMSCGFRDIPVLLGILDKAYSWLVDTSNDIFVRDMDGRPVKVVDPLLQVGCPIMHGSMLIFKPCIIRDAQDVRYAGISMVSPKDGEMTNFTSPEFAMFKMAITGFGQNYYLINQMLINQTISYCTYNNLMEVLNRNGKSVSKS